MTRIHLTVVLAAATGLIALGSAPASAVQAVDPAPKAAPALPDGSFQVAGFRFFKGKWLDDATGEVFDELPQSLRKVAPTQPNAVGRVPSRPLPKLPDEAKAPPPPPVYDSVPPPPARDAALPRYESPTSKFDGNVDNGAGIANQLPSPPKNVAPPRTPPGSFRGEATAVARVSPLPRRVANVRRAAAVVAEQAPQRAPSFFKRNKWKIIGGLVFVGATGILIGAPMVVEKLDQEGVFDGGNTNDNSGNAGDNGTNGTDGNNGNGLANGEQRYD